MFTLNHGYDIWFNQMDSDRWRYWQDIIVPIAAKVFRMENSTLSYAAKKIRILHGKEWYGRHVIYGMDDFDGQLPPEDNPLMAA